MSLTETPRSNQLHIGIYGKRNSGKSSLINALTNQEIALVSGVAGTTADPVYKTMEIYGIGPCVFIDTAGFDDEGELGFKRVEKTKGALEKTDLAMLVCADEELSKELEWAEYLKERKIPYVLIQNKIDLDEKKAENLSIKIFETFGIKPVMVSAKEKTGIEKVREELIRNMPKDYEQESIVGSLAGEGDTVLLVMPQDIQAPKGRLILPQVQTMRDLLDKKCLVMSCTTDKLESALLALAKPPKLIITDSQVFKTVYDHKPEESMLTSFSVLFAQYKGDIKAFVEGAKAIESLNENSRVLIAEACTHAPLAEDIGREKIPNILRKRIGENLKVDITAGSDFPEDLRGYDLIIHCGACMFNRKYVLSRMERAKAAGVPITNYGVTLAYLTGILDKIQY